MPAPSKLSRREREIMDILYALGSATTEQMCQAMEKPPSGNAVRTLIQILETKGHLRRKRQGKEYIYRPTQSRARAGLSALRHVLAIFYEGSAAKALAAHLARGKEQLAPDEYERIKQLIEKSKEAEP